jgi:hypothetical protein
VNNEWERKWKASVMASFIVVSWHLPGVTGENVEKISG